LNREPLAKSQRLWHHAGMPKKLPKNQTDVNLLARSVVEAAIGESLAQQITPRVTSKRKPEKPKRSTKGRK